MYSPHWLRLSQLLGDLPNSFNCGASSYSGITAHISPDKSLDILDCSLREHWSKCLPPFFRLVVLEENEGSRPDARCSIQTFIFVPSFGGIVDIVECRRLAEMELHRLEMRTLNGLSGKTNLVWCYTNNFAYRTHQATTSTLDFHDLTVFTMEIEK